MKDSGRSLEAWPLEDCSIQGCLDPLHDKHIEGSQGFVRQKWVKQENNSGGGFKHSQKQVSSFVIYYLQILKCAFFFHKFWLLWKKKCMYPHTFFWNFQLFGQIQGGQISWRKFPPSNTMVKIKTLYTELWIWDKVLGDIWTCIFIYLFIDGLTVHRRETGRERESGMTLGKWPNVLPLQTTLLYYCNYQH